MSHNDEQKRADAIAWFLRLKEPADADWDGFMDWLEEDPAHDALYQEVAEAHDSYDAAVVEAPVALPSNDNPLPPRRRWKLATGLATAAAASIAGVVGYPLMMAAPATYAVETAAGQRDAIRLADGTRIMLNGDSRVTLRKGDDRFASLDRGEAVFTVTHDAAHPFTVQVGDDAYQDLGTVFNIARDANGVETAVASGAVLYNPGREAVRIGAGRVLRVSAKANNVTLGDVDPASVAAWRHGKLVYKHAPIGRIAGDLSRNLGVPVKVSPDIAARTFSGVIMLGGDDDIIFPRVAALLDVNVTHEATGWRMSSRVRDAR